MEDIHVYAEKTSEWFVTEQLTTGHTPFSEL